ncbi:MAG TPA: BPSL0067 family protein [Telluria sp.]|nr:BPSL0067 family protein [Telluria sp.]
MCYTLSLAETDVLGAKQFVNAAGNTECVEFVRQVTGARGTPLWTQGANVLDSPPGIIRRGTAIATFDAGGKYPKDKHGKHAAIYLSHDSIGIRVLDQWNSQGKVRERTIYARRPDFPRSDCAKHFCVIE